MSDMAAAAAATAVRIHEERMDILLFVNSDQSVKSEI